MKLGEVWQRPNGWTRPGRATEQHSFKPVFVPITRERPRHSGSFGSLQILVGGSQANRAAAGDRSQPQAQVKSQSKNFFDLAHGQSPGWQAISLSWGGCLSL